jgi:hypothetical protein
VYSIRSVAVGLVGSWTNQKKTPSKHLWQLSIWILIREQNDIYKKDVKLCVDSPPVSRFAIQSIFIEALLKKDDIFPVFRRASMNIDCIANLETGGESTHSFTSFLYISFCSMINIQMLNF